MTYVTARVLRKMGARVDVTVDWIIGFNQASHGSEQMDAFSHAVTLHVCEDAAFLFRFVPWTKRKGHVKQLLYEKRRVERVYSNQKWQQPLAQEIALQRTAILAATALQPSSKVSSLVGQKKAEVR